MKTFNDYTNEIIQFMQTEKGLRLDPIPKILINTDEHSRFDPFVPTGHYDFINNQITLYISNRQCKDILRTLCHELIHVSQYQENPKEYSNFDKSGSVADNSILRKYEAEAYIKGSLYFRDWTETYNNL